MAVYNVQWTAGTHSKFTILKVCKTFTCGSIPQLLYKAVINKTGALTAMNYVLDIKNEKNVLLIISFWGISVIKSPSSPIKHLCVTLVEVQYRRDWYIVSSILTA